MLDGWRNQQLARYLSFGTVEARERLVRRFRYFADAPPWAWTAADADEFFAGARAVKNASHSTLVGYQTTLRQFCDYLTDPHYGWPAECEDRLGTHPIQVCTEWNTGRRVQEARGRPGKRALTHDELQALFASTTRTTGPRPRNIAVNQSSPWLFPGNRPGQHIHSTHLMNHLAGSGVQLLGTRLAAIRTLVQEMPPAVAAQALGCTPECAEDHAIQAGAPGPPMPPTGASPGHPEPEARALPHSAPSQPHPAW